MTRFAGMGRQELGKMGEDLASQSLQQQGMREICRNWRCPAGELDLVMEESGVLVIVEVKTRRGQRYGRAEESVSAAQRATVLASAEWFVQEHPEWHDAIWRVDLVAIEFGAATRKPRLSHYRNALVDD